MMSVTILYDNAKHDGEKVRDRIVIPYVKEVLGIYKNLDGHYRFQKSSDGIDSFRIECGNRSPALEGFAASKRLGLDVLEDHKDVLADHKFFLKSFRRN